MKWWHYMVLPFMVAGWYLLTWYDRYVLGCDHKSGPKYKFKIVNGCFYMKQAGLVNIFKRWTYIDIMG